MAALQQIKKPPIRIIKTKPKIHEERKVLITIGPDNHDCHTYNNVDIWKYGDVFCYHENIWEVRPNIKKIAFLWADSEITLNAMKQHVGDVYFMIARKAFIDKHKIVEQQKSLKLTGIFPIEELMSMQPIFYNQLKMKLERNEFSPQLLAYPLALTFSKNYIYHFEQERYETPDFYNVFGETNIYWTNNPEHNSHIREYFAPIYLFQQYYVPGDSNRRREINYCMKKNIHSGYFDKIFLMNEKIYDKFDLRELEDPVVQQINLKRRMTYQDVINYTNTILPEHCYVIIANSDIYFNKSIFSMFNINLHKTLLALLRFDLIGDLYDKDYQQVNIFGPRDDSQDVWVFKKQDGLPSDGGFALGQKGCDNAITGVFLKSKFRILNPAFNIQTIHVHMSNLRTYDQKRIVYYPYYTMIEPHAILSKQIKSVTIDDVIYKSERSKQYEQLYPHFSQEIRTFMTYAKKKHGFAPEFQQNVMSTRYDYNRIYRFRNMFCDNNGSIFNKDIQYSLLADKNKISYVNNHNLKHISALQRAILISQYGDDTSLETKGLFWFLKNSLPRLLVMSQSNISSSTFICNINTNLAKYLEKVNVFLKFVKSNPKTAHFVSELIVPQPLEELNYPREFINLIRKHFNVTDDAEDTNNKVVLVRDMVFHDEDEEWDKFRTQIREKIEESVNFELEFIEIRDEPENYVTSVEHFKSALVVIGHRCEIMANCIFTPRNASVYEIAFESTPDLQLWNLCAAAEHHYTLVPYKREPKSRQQYMAIKKAKMAIETSPWKYEKYHPYIETITGDDVPAHIFVEKREYPFRIKLRNNPMREVDGKELLHGDEVVLIQNLCGFIRSCEEAGFLEQNTIQLLSGEDASGQDFITIEYGEGDDKEIYSGGPEMVNRQFLYCDFENLYKCKYTPIEEKLALNIDLEACEIPTNIFETLYEYKYCIMRYNDLELMPTTIYLYACFASGTIPVLGQNRVEIVKNLPLNLQEGGNYLVCASQGINSEDVNHEEDDIKELLENIDETTMKIISRNNYRLYNDNLSMITLLSHMKNELRKKD
jgi:hypothetical protein